MISRLFRLAALMSLVASLALRAAPQVAVIEDAPWSPADFAREGAAELAVLLRLAEMQRGGEPVGLIGLGDARGCFQAGTQRALEFAAERGVPVVRLCRAAKSRAAASGDCFISGGDLSAAEAQELLTVCLARFGPLPSGANSAARERRIQLYQAAFDARLGERLASR